MAIATKKTARKFWAGSVDNKRRITLPPGVPPHSAVTIHQVDECTWIVKRERSDRNVALVLIPVVDKLPDDPAWEKIEARIGRQLSRRLPEPVEDE